MANATYSVSRNDHNFFRVGVRILKMVNVSFRGALPAYSLLTNISTRAFRELPAQPQHPDWHLVVEQYLNFSPCSNSLSGQRRKILRDSYLKHDQPFRQQLRFSLESLRCLAHGIVGACQSPGSMRSVPALGGAESPRAGAVALSGPPPVRPLQTPLPLPKTAALGAATTPRQGGGPLPAPHLLFPVVEVILNPALL